MFLIASMYQEVVHPDYPASGGRKDTFLHQLKRVFTSAILLTISYVLFFLVHQFITAGLCKAFGYEPVITYNHIGNLPMEYQAWSVKRITLIFSSGPLVCLLAGIFFLDLFNSLTGKGTLLRFSVLWAAICGINLFCAFLLLSPIAVENFSSDLYTGFSIVGAWWRLGRLLMIPVSFLAMTGSVLLGYFIGDMFLKFSFSRTLIDSCGGRRKVILQLYFLPVLAAAPVLLSLTSERSFLLHCFLLLSLLITGIGMIVGADSDKKSLRVYGKDVLNTVPVLWLALTVALIGYIWFFFR